jgi:long-chain acyl-CoA synthetase
MVYGDNKPYNVALVVANVDAVKKWGAENGVSESDPTKLLANAKVQKLFKTELDHYGEKFKGFEGVKDFALIPEDFTTENGMLTPSLKVKRRKVVEVYQPVIDALYAKKKEKPAEGGGGGDKKKAEASAE